MDSDRRMNSLILQSGQFFFHPFSYNNNNKKEKNLRARSSPMMGGEAKGGRGWVPHLLDRLSPIRRRPMLEVKARFLQTRSQLKSISVGDRAHKVNVRAAPSAKPL